MAPRLDENGRPYSLYEQRKHFFAMDFFTVQREPIPNTYNFALRSSASLIFKKFPNSAVTPGRNVISRSSLASSLTISWPQRLEELERDPNLLTPDCGCGWPQHLLIPKGTPAGLPFDLFLMVTNGEEDAVGVGNGPSQRPASCRAAPIYCGVPGQLYPDARPMGYPFDRLPYSVHDPVQEADGRLGYSPAVRMVASVEEYARGIPNSATTQVRITRSL
jgi:hypothetical protein